ncbi:diguanylate cyclase, partial [Raoultella sp. 18098]
SGHDVHASSLPASFPLNTAHLNERNRQPFTVEAGGVDYRAKVIVMDDSGPLPVWALVAKPFAPVLAPFLRLEALFAVSVLFSAGVSALAVRMVARRVVTPLEDVAQKDALTGLANRRTFEARLQRAEQELRKSGAGFSVMLMDLDKFKFVN